jgi:hypothetical protein
MHEAYRTAASPPRRPLTRLTVLTGLLRQQIPMTLSIIPHLRTRQRLRSNGATRMSRHAIIFNRRERKERVHVIRVHEQVVSRLIRWLLSASVFNKTYQKISLWRWTIRQQLLGIGEIKRGKQFRSLIKGEFGVIRIGWVERRIRGPVGSSMTISARRPRPRSGRQELVPPGFLDDIAEQRPELDSGYYHQPRPTSWTYLEKALWPIAQRPCRCA